MPDGQQREYHDIWAALRQERLFAISNGSGGESALVGAENADFPKFTHSCFDGARM
jgi:hypothetical protein